MAGLTRNAVLIFILAVVSETTGYDPDLENVYHLFTIENPTVSQPLLPGNLNLLSASNFDPNRRSVYILHGGGESVTSNSIAVLVTAFLQAADVNLIAVDWSNGASGPNFFRNVLLSGESGARFLNWLNSITGASPVDYHFVGYSLGAHQAGIVGRNVDGVVGYITALDPANLWQINANRFRPDDGAYTEAIHTNAGVSGFGRPLAQADFYPNGGNNMPGCGGGSSCNHARAYYYFAESITSGGFTGQECATYAEARAATCDLPGILQMGGLTPKTGSTGLYYMSTNAASPFSRG